MADNRTRLTLRLAPELHEELARAAGPRGLTSFIEGCLEVILANNLAEVVKMHQIGMSQTPWLLRSDQVSYTSALQGPALTLDGISDAGA